MNKTYNYILKLRDINERDIDSILGNIQCVLEEYHNYKEQRVGVLCKYSSIDEFESNLIGISSKQ